MQFAAPIWILFGFISCIILYLSLHFMEKRRRKSLEGFAAKSLLAGLTANVSTRKRRIKRILLVCSVFCCFLALAKPQYGHRWIDVTRKGIDILIALDTSASMLAEDIKPNRLERSKYAILDFINQLEGDRVGLMPFAGSSFLMCPLTVDYIAFEQSLQAVTTEIIPQPGTNIAQAIHAAETILNNDANHKLLLIITDGENLGGDMVVAAKDAAEKGMTIFTVGVGTAKGELIPLNREGKQGFVKDESGAFVTSRLDEKTLKQVSEATGGLYTPLGDRGQGLMTIYQQKLALIPKEELTERRKKVPVERFPWPIGGALLLLICEFLLNSRKSSPYSFTFPFIRSRFKKLVTVSFGLLFLTSAKFSHCSPGEEAYHNEDYLSASQYYEKALEKDPDNVTLHYNMGATAYKNNLFDDAIVSFNLALKSDNLSLQQKAYFNRGNAQYKKGEETLQAEPQKTIEQWQNAIESYQATLELQPDNEEAKANHSLVKQKLEELKKQQENQQKNEQQEGQEDNKDQGQQQQPNQDPSQNPGEQEEGQGQQDQQQDQQPEDQEQQNADKEKTGDNSDAQEKKGSENKDEQQPSAAEQQNSTTNTGEPEGEKGKLSKEEAIQLLDEIKNDEGTLNFIPQKDNKRDNGPGGNW